MAPPALAVVFFDAAGTLVRVRGGVGARYAAIAREFGVGADPGALEAAFPDAFRVAPPMAFPGASPAEVPGLERRVWRGLVRGVVERAGCAAAFDGARFDAYFDALYAHFATAAAWEVYPDVEPTLRAVRARGCRLGVITNFDGRIVPLLEGLGLAGWFDSLTLSSGVGATKPAAAIFQAALARHGVGADAALHVGDSATEDYDGARAAGLRALFLDRRGRAPHVTDGSRIASLAEVVSRLWPSAGRGIDEAGGPTAPPCCGPGPGAP